MDNLLAIIHKFIVYPPKNIAENLSSVIANYFSLFGISVTATFRIK
jgi:hypothetical protein